METIILVIIGIGFAMPLLAYTAEKLLKK